MSESQHQDDRARGWELYGRVKQARQAANRAWADGDPAGRYVAEIHSCLRDYARLTLPRPDLLHSLLIANVCLLERTPQWGLDFLCWACPDSWRPEDFQSDVSPDGKTFPPLVARVALKAGKLAHECDECDKKRFALGLVEMALLRASSELDKWLRRDNALLLGDLGREEEAIQLLVPFVRDESASFWAWQDLGRLYEASDCTKALGLLAKAKLLCKDPVFALPLFEDLARVALRCGEVSLAKWAVNQAVETRSTHDYKLRQSLKDLMDGEWYASAVESEDPIALLRGLAAHADDVLYVDLPLEGATFLCVFTAKDGRERAKLAVHRHGQAEELVCPLSTAPAVRNMAAGAPVSIRIDEGGHGPRVVDAHPRDDGASFDCLDKLPGVIQHQNVEKQLASVYLNPDDFILLHYSDFPAAADLPAGQGVEVVCASHEDRLRAYNFVAMRVAEGEDIRLVRDGLRKHEKGFAFVDDVFLSPPLAEPWDDGQLVDVVAVRQWSRKGPRRLQWNAVAVHAVG